MPLLYYHQVALSDQCIQIQAQMINTTGNMLLIQQVLFIYFLLIKKKIFKLHLKQKHCRINNTLNDFNY